jgi:toxin YoeB
VNIVFSPQAWEDYQHWQMTDRTILKRLNRLINDTRRDPYQGIGKPEPLKYGLTGAWSRRITDEHRLVYRVTNGNLEIFQAGITTEHVQ